MNNAPHELPHRHPADSGLPDKADSHAVAVLRLTYDWRHIIDIIEKNILQDNNGKHEPLGAESQSAEETVLLFNHSKQKL